MAKNNADSLKNKVHQEGLELLKNSPEGKALQDLKGRFAEINAVIIKDWNIDEADLLLQSINKLFLEGHELLCNSVSALSNYWSGDLFPNGILDTELKNLYRLIKFEPKIPEDSQGKLIGYLLRKSSNVEREADSVLLNSHAYALSMVNFGFDALVDAIFFLSKSVDGNIHCKIGSIRNVIDASVLMNNYKKDQCRDLAWQNLIRAGSCFTATSRSINEHAAEIKLARLGEKFTKSPTDYRNDYIKRLKRQHPELTSDQRFELADKKIIGDIAITTFGKLSSK